MSIDVEAIRALAQILAESGLTEIEVGAGDSRVRVAKMPSPVVGYAPAAPPLPAAPPATAPDAEPAGAVTSPMVGVVYLSAEPGAAPYVAPGQTVAAGQTLLLIEAMKTYNQIKAPHAGTVTRILVATGQPVEYGEVLMVIE